MQTITSRAHGFDTYVYEYKRDGNNKLIVPNLSDLQGQIDFVIPQIYQGGYWNEFPVLWEKLAAPCGIRGHYTYQVSWDSWLKQAEEVLAHTPSDCQFMVLDIEKIGNTVDKTMLADSSRILHYWQENKPAGVKKVLYYANPDIYVNFILPIMGKYYPQDKWYLEFDLWVSQWPWLKSLRSPDNNPALPKNMRGDWKLYQYTDAGDKSLYSAADLDVFNGPVSDMRKWLGLDVVEPPAPESTPLPSHVLELHHADNDTTESVSFEGIFHLDQQVDYVAVDSMHFLAPTPEPTPTPEPEPIPNADTVKYGILKTQIIKNGLTLNGKYTPAVVQIQDSPRPSGSKGGAIPVLPAAAEYIRKINNERGAHYALETVGAMWINTPWNPGEIPHAESITCQHNFVSWEKEQNGCAKLRCFMNDEKFDFDPARVNWHTRPDLFFKAIALNLQGRFINVQNDVDCFIPLMARHSNNGTGELWLALSEIEPFAELPAKVKIEAGKLNIRKTPGMDGEDIGDYIAGEDVTLLQYRPIGASVWGRTDRGWICLLLADKPGQRDFLTSWRLETEGVIPPE